METRSRTTDLEVFIRGYHRLLLTPVRRSRTAPHGLSPTAEKYIPPNKKLVPQRSLAAAVSTHQHAVDRATRCDSHRTIPFAFHLASSLHRQRCQSTLIAPCNGPGLHLLRLTTRGRCGNNERKMWKRCCFIGMLSYILFRCLWCCR
jgi:hypothetical protein